MNPILIPFLIICLTVLICKLFEKNECDHAQQTYYDASGDELPGDQTEACFSECVKCGKKFVIPSGFQSDSHFEHFLYEREQASSKNHNKKNKNDN
jgi:hypothetical protein